MTRRLIMPVLTRDPLGRAVTLMPGESVPDWAEEQIMGPHVWEANEPEPGPEGSEGSEGDTDGPELGPDPEGGLKPPAGNASRAEWFDYATALGAEVAPDATVKEIKAAAEAASK